MKRYELQHIESRRRVVVDALRACNGVEVYLWRPSDWASIVATLSPDTP
ncbi:MAG: hypothetical protein WHS44_08080 [Fimbriimonadales bacterium]